MQISRGLNFHFIQCVMNGVFKLKRKKPRLFLTTELFVCPSRYTKSIATDLSRSFDCKSEEVSEKSKLLNFRKMSRFPFSTFNVMLDF